MKIVVVGGGTAGWLAALMISKIKKEHEVTVIESSKIGIIGAGEGSTGTLTNIVQNVMDDLGCDEQDFIREADATLKYGIRHKAWNNNLDFSYVGPIDGTRTSNTQSDIVFNHALANLDLKDIHVATDLGMKIYYQRNTFHEVEGDHAYHFDAHKVGKYFKKVCGEKVKHYDTEVEHVIQHPDTGFITALKCANGETVNGDFFIDATGFKRMLINAVGGKWKSYKDNLPVNSAMPFLLPYEEDEQIEPVTTAWAQRNGWCWQIPTKTRRGCGYVFCDDFVTPEQAQDELEATIGKKIDPIKILKFDAGRQDKQWMKNCMSIGLAGAFAEPLEATSIHTTIIQLKDFVYGCLEKTVEETCNIGQVDAFNNRMGNLYDSLKDFLVAHYTCGRNDTEFWQYIDAGHTMTDFVREMHGICKLRVPNYTLFPRFEGSAGWPLWSYVLAGTGKLSPAVARREIELNNDEILAAGSFNNDVSFYEEVCSKLPSNTEVIRG